MIKTINITKPVGYTFYCNNVYTLFYTSIVNFKSPSNIFSFLHFESERWGTAISIHRAKMKQ